MAWAPREDSDQPGHPPMSGCILDVFVCCNPDSEDSDQTGDLSLCWTHVILFVLS